MAPHNINDEIATLPPEAQQQVLDFIEFLKMRYKKGRPDKKAVRNRIVNEPFIGIWEGRQDMSDSSKWVRSTRESEWGMS